MSERRRRRPWSDIFEFFERIDELFDELMERSFERAFERETEGIRVEGPYVYGFSMRIGPDGKPIIHEFGNIRRMRGRPIIVPEREPLVDVVEADDEIIVTIEVPGVEKDQINLNCTETELRVSVKHPERGFDKTIELPAKVRPEEAKASYRNGILEVRLPRAEKKPRPGKEIRIE